MRKTAVDYATKPTTSQFRLKPQEAEELWAATSRVMDDRDCAEFTPDEFVDLALEVTPHLPHDLRRRIIDFRRYAPAGDVVVLSGLLPEGVMFPATATAPSEPPVGLAQNAALLLTSVTAMLGEPFNYSTLYGGRIVQNIVPVRDMEFTQTSQSSAGMLDWHCEDSFREDRCDYVGLLCLRGDLSTASKYAQVKDVLLPPDLLATLREPRFRVRPDPAHILAGDASMRQLAILSGLESAPEIAYDMYRVEPVDETDAEAAFALRELNAGLDKIAQSHAMEKGDLLLFDNKRVVHARTPFAARFDGTDRWLMRTMICGSALTFRRWGQRIPD
jgi:L-asparagine oxygenase